jgi:hypothetical protein
VEDDLSSLADITFPEPPSYVKMSDINKSSRYINNSVLCPPAEERQSEEHHRSISMMQPRQKKFMNKLYDHKIPDNNDYTDAGGPKVQARQLVISSIHQYKNKEQKLLSFFEKLIDKIGFKNLIPIMNDYIVNFSSGIVFNFIILARRKTKSFISSVRMTPIHLLITNNLTQVLDFLIFRNNKFLAPESPKALRGAKKSFRSILSNNDLSMISGNF